MYKEKLPHSQTALILGISSIFTSCCCWGIIGVIVGIIGLFNANKAIAIHYEFPDQYDGINNAQTGKTTSIIGIIIGILTMSWIVYVFSTGDYQYMYEEYNNMLNE